MILSDELTPRDIETVLHRLGIEPNGRTDSNGWTTIKSPLRDERNPSFGINLQTGAWKDHGTDESGDLVTLAERVQNFDTKQAITWIKEQTDLSGVLYAAPSNGSTYKNKSNKKEVASVATFWTDDRKKSLTAAQKRLKNNPEHPVIQQANQYDCLELETLQFYGIGLIKKWSKDWLAFPYKTGGQLYRREDGKVIRSLKGSSPGQSFFGSRKITGNKDTLYIAKSPRETMLLHQEYGDRGDVIGLATGEQGNVSQGQIEALTGKISASNYSEIYVFLDCDSEAAKITAESFTSELSKALDRQIKLVNIDDYSGGAFKDVTNCIQAGMDTQTFENMLKESETISNTWFKPLNPFNAPVAPLEFIINGVAAKGMVTLLGGTAGSGKSILMQYLLQLRDSQPLIEVSRGEGIFLTGLDSSETEIRRRAKSIGQGEGLYTVAIPDETVPFITNETFYEELEKQLIKMGADAIVFDTVADFHEGNLYDASEVNLTMSAFRRLASATGCAIILITHTRKSADSKRDYSINDIADSRIFATKSDFVFALKSEYQIDETNLIELRCLKSRSPKPKAPVRAKIEFNESRGRVLVTPTDKLFQIEENELDEQQRIENRRKEAARLKDEGKSLREIGELLNASHETIRKDLEHHEQLSTVKNPS